MKQNKRNRRTDRSGFTLVEVMIVLFILVTMAGLAVYALQGQRQKANRQNAYIYIKTLENAIDLYEANVGYPPTTAQGLQALIACPPDLPNQAAWAGPYIKDSATSKDPWGMDYDYASPGNNGRAFDIWSYGPDMINGTEDDIGNWMPRID